MTQEDRYKIVSNDFVDLFISYNGNERLLNQFPNATTQIMDARYAIAYAPSSILSSNFISKYDYAALPHCFGLTSNISLDASEVSKLRRIPNFSLQGKGVLMGIIDTGIDYTNSIFIHEDGTSKIISIWDQTIDSEDQYPPNTFFGTEYNSEMINKAISNEHPLEIVPSVDEIGHGTMLAGIMVGSEVPLSNFSGLAPSADIIVVKLKQAKQNLRDFLLIPKDVPCYQENDIMWAVHYINDISTKLNRPCSICIGLGTSQGSHDESGPLNELLNYLSDFYGLAITVSAGNEGNSRRHFFGEIDPAVGKTTVELYIGEKETGFSMELWGSAPDTYSIDILSPTGEFYPRIPESLKSNREISFVFETTTISVNYRLIETSTGEQLILLRFKNPAMGVWRLQIYSKGNLPGNFHIWLPMGEFITSDTYFIDPDRFTTITSPGNTMKPLTITAYNPSNKSLYDKASKGYTRNNDIKPDLAAPGVNITVPTLKKDFTSASGTGLAAAHTAGINAILLEWGIINGYYPYMNSTIVKKYLIRGADRSRYLQYPNQDWGYGTINLYNTFNILRTDFPKV